MSLGADGFCRSMNRAGEEMSGISCGESTVHLTRLLVPDQVALARRN